MFYDVYVIIRKLLVTLLLPGVGYIIPQSGVSHIAHMALDISEIFQWKGNINGYQSE